MATIEIPKLDFSLLEKPISGDTTERIRKALSVHQALPFDSIVSLTGKAESSNSDALEKGVKDGWLESSKYVNPQTGKEQSWYRIKKTVPARSIQIEGLRVSHRNIIQMQSFIDIRDIPLFAMIPQIGSGTQDDFQREKLWSWIRKLYQSFNDAIKGTFLPMTTNLILAYWDEEQVKVNPLPGSKRETGKHDNSIDTVIIEIKIPEGGWWPWEMPFVVLDGQQRLTAIQGIMEPIIVPIHLAFESGAAMRAKLFLVANATKNVATSQKDEVARQIEALGAKEILTNEERKGASIEDIVRMINEIPGALKGRIDLPGSKGDISSRVFHDALGKYYAKQLTFGIFVDKDQIYREGTRQMLANSIAAFFDHVEAVFPKGWTGKKHQLNKAFGISIMLRLFAYFLANFEKATDIGNPAAWDDRMQRRLEQLREDGFDWDDENLFSLGGWTYGKVAEALERIESAIDNNRSAYE
jgi:hypothetical protein